MGLFKIGSFIRFIPVSIVIGFTNGIAVLIGLSQIKDFLGLNIAKMPADFFHQIETLAGAINTVNPYAVGLGLASLIIVFVWPRSWTIGGAPWRRWLARIPSTVVVLIVMTALVSLFNLPLKPSAPSSAAFRKDSRSSKFQTSAGAMSSSCSDRQSHWPC